MTPETTNIGSPDAGSLDTEPPLVACLSAYDEALVRKLAGTDRLRVRIARPTCTPEDLQDLLRDADLVIADAARRHLLDRAAIAAMTRCRLIQQPAVGYDSIDVAEATARGIPVANTPGANAAAVADWVIMATLALLRDGFAAQDALRSGVGYTGGLANELGALTVGLVGMGAVGRQVSARLQGFGSQVIYTTRRPVEVPRARAVTLNRLLADADVVSLHLPLTGETRGLLGTEQIERMKPGAILVNSARGALVDTRALIAGLRRGRPAAAALDVFDPEPLDADSALRELDNVYLSPHIAANSHQARSRVRRAVAENLRRVLGGQRPVNVVNIVNVANVANVVNPESQRSTWSGL